MIDPHDSLTKRELEVIELLCQDLTYKEIAYRLSIAHGTVRGHIHRIIVKLGVQSSIGVVMYAVRNGLVE